MSIVPPRPLISPHPKAPIFSSPDGGLILQQILTEASTGRFPDTERFMELLRQAGFVNLWFFLKVIAAYSGPFESLTPTLHLDMCNFFQSRTLPGKRAGMFIPRSHGKSTCTTEGGNAWKILRNPDERLKISGATYDRAQSFMLSIKAIFDSNKLVAELYPEYIPQPNQKRWNDTEIVLPNRSKNFREPTVLPGGAGGSAEGFHHTGHTLDDPFGEKALNAMRGSSADMQNVKNWFWTNAPSLLVSPMLSWIFAVGTRYAIDDLWGEIIDRAYEVVGGNMPGFVPAPDGQWSVYYRSAVEDGEPILPEWFSNADFAQIAKDDYWTWATQYENNPQGSGIAEFSGFSLQKASMELLDDGDYWIVWQEGPEEHRASLLECDVIMSVDPAGTERYVSAKTSRSAVVVLATHHSGRRFVIDLRADYVDPLRLFDWMFELATKYRRYLRASFLEASAGFKVLGPILRREEVSRGQYLNLRTFPAIGDKDSRIRNELGPVMSRKRLFVVDAFRDKIEEETKGFPQSAKKDVLDATASAVKASVVPLAPEEVDGLEKARTAWRRRTTNLAGY